MPDTPDFGTMIAQGAIEVPNSPFNVPLSTTSAFNATPDPIAHALAICVTPLANAVSVVVTGVQTGVVYASRLFNTGVGIIEVPAITSMDTDYTIAVTANAVGAVTCHVVAVPDAPPWGTLITRGELECPGSPFHVNAGSGVTNTFVPPANAHALAVVLSNALNVAVVSVLGHQSGAFYVNRALNMTIGVIIVPILTAVDQSYDVNVQTLASGATDVHVIAIDDIMATGVYTDVPLSSPTSTVATRVVPFAGTTTGTANGGTGSTPGITVAAKAGFAVHVTEVSFTLINGTGAAASRIPVQVTTKAVGPTILLGLALSTTVTNGDKDHIDYRDIVGVVGENLVAQMTTALLAGYFGYVTMTWFYDSLS